MRIRASDADSLLDPDGAPLLLSTSVLSVAPASRAWGQFAANDLLYRGFDELGTDGHRTASWAEYGPFPRHIVPVLTDQELALLYPEDEQFRLWFRLTREANTLDPPPPVAQGLLAQWVAEPVRPRGWLPQAPSPEEVPFEHVSAFEGAVWVVSGGTVSILDLTTDTAIRLTPEGAYFRAGIVPSALGPLTDSPLDALALPGPARGVVLRACPCAGGERRVEAAVLTTAGVVRYRYSLGDPARVLERTLLVQDGVDYHCGLARDAWYVFGTQGGALRGRRVTFDEVVSPLTVPALPAQAPRAAESTDLWVTTDRGVLRSADGLRWEMFAGIKNEDVGVEPRYRSIDRCDRIVDFAVERGVPAVLLHLTAEQGGGSMLNVLDPSMRQIVYRRRYPTQARRLVASPTPVVSSVRVTPGETLTPRFGLGPEDV